MAAPLVTDPLSALLHRLTMRANEAEDVEAVLEAAVRDVCDTLGWPAGAAHVDSADGPVPGTAIGADVPASPDVRTRAATTGQPQWEPAADAPPQGLLTVVVPVQAGSGPVGALHFLATSIDDGLAQVLETIGWQLGMVVQRDRDRRALEQREAALERSNEELERFAYVASHDLQEPLRKIVTACELLERRHAEELSDDAARYLDVAVDGAKRMQTLIRDLLTYSRITRGERGEGDTADLGAVVQEVLEGLSIVREETQADIEVGALPVVSIGVDEARQLLSNLVGNALKYHGDSPPEVVVDAEDRDGSMVELTVCDNGIGIDPEYHERIFDVFRRLHRRDEYSGTGIGLAIVKRIAEHHGGRAWVTGRPEGGSCFHVLLPRGGT